MRVDHDCRSETEKAARRMLRALVRDRRRSGLINEANLDPAQKQQHRHRLRLYDQAIGVYERADTEVELIAAAGVVAEIFGAHLERYESGKPASKRK